ncbi:MAG: cob(I)yrinic acid a,c-diamide adenosyltransferase [bacterium]
MIQVYTGNGKGKTTAAVGLALRALGAGRRVYMAQFIKDRDSSEITPLRAAGADVEQFGHGMILGREVTAEDRAAAARGVVVVRGHMDRKEYDVVVMDEVNVAVKLGLVGIDLVIDLMKSCASEAELVITGRDAHPQVLERADLVTEMREVKHYFTAGVDARLGIEY